mmetsp:Transcript_30275/g.97400  ORF Transcript_30275/g.97400 Transcript_30275/m.97400 type:complete len:807 (-) Transcript_30275:22-2442(-)
MVLCSKQEDERNMAAENERRELEAKLKSQAEKEEEEWNKSVLSGVKSAAGVKYQDEALSLSESIHQLVSSTSFNSMEELRHTQETMLKEICAFLVKRTNASFVAVARLEDSDTLHYKVAADKKDVIVDHDEDGNEENVEHKEAPQPEITVRNLPPMDDDMAYVLRRGNGITFERVVDLNKGLCVTDVKFVEGMFFFDQKRQGTYLAVPIRSGKKVVGIISADTLDSLIEAELKDFEIPQFMSAAFILSAFMERSELLYRNQILKRRKESLTVMSKRANTLPDDMAQEIVSSIQEMLPACSCCVGVCNLTSQILVLSSSGPSWQGTCNGVVDETKEEHGLMMKAVASKLLEVKTREESVEEVAIPILDEQKVTAVVHVKSAPGSSIPQFLIDFQTSMSSVVASVLLSPARSAKRVLSIIAAAAVGDPKNLFQHAAAICRWHSSSSSIKIVAKHGPDSLRILFEEEETDSNVIERSSIPACEEATRSRAVSFDGTSVVVPLMHKEDDRTPYGLILAKTSSVSEEQMSILEAIGSALSDAFEVVEFRRKMSIASVTALEALLKKLPKLRGACLSFPDSCGFNIVARVLGSFSHPVVVGERLQNFKAFQKVAVAREGCAAVGNILVAGEELEQTQVNFHEETPLVTLSSFADILCTVAERIRWEKMRVDRTDAELREGEEMLLQHFNVCRFDMQTERAIQDIGMIYIDNIRESLHPNELGACIFQAIMYILGHQQRDVSQWKRCRKLITHHLFKEMKMIDIRAPLTVHKLKLARERISALSAADIAMEAGPHALQLWKWVLMILEIQGVE